MTDDAALLAALAVLQQHGHIGQPLGDAVAHSDRFVRAVPAATRTLVDLGSGGGLPGLVIAARLPALQVTLVERREARADDLRRAVNRLGLADRITVITGDVDRVTGAFEVVTARAFAAPSVTLGVAVRLLIDGGVALISDPPGDSRQHWREALALHGSESPGGAVVDLGAVDGIHRFQRCST